ncbi:MAG: glycosyltransferase, partial [Candidatus Hydrogenedentota bacterium]
MPKRILMVAHRYLPHLGGVERHVESLSLELTRRGHEVSILTEHYDLSLRSQENVNGVTVHRYKAARGALRNLSLAPFVYLDRSKKYRRLFAEADVVHCHDWLPFLKFLMPFRMMNPGKSFFITFHGWSGRFPPSRSEVFVHRMCVGLTRGNICVGAFIAKWYRFAPGMVIYGAADPEREIRDRVP